MLFSIQGPYGRKMWQKQSRGETWQKERPGNLAKTNL